ncbi:hypothetical protein P3T97_14055 (plasmid) [Mammaliicoccus sciuri]|uniref:hypothetical protein n=1 Tax=Mammaliicoccus sciuri TaxID=1296 RepID=UPI0023B0424F|nr:hypothetical protein [Mammaliicoccus sciuri]MDE9962300.1 hypothetical protein [Staphylococcus pseudintermedius]WQJ67241.1 hypothetical protein P3T97_14055 [Mammaliicoccus sciuri]
MDREEVYNTVKDTVKHSSYFKAQVITENTERANEVTTIENVMDQLDKLDKLNINSDSNKDFDNMNYSSILDEYKKAYQLQEELYLYQINNNIYDDEVLTKKYYNNTIRLNELETNYLKRSDLYETQLETKNTIFSDNHRNKQNSKITERYNHLSEDFYSNKDDKIKANNVQEEMIGTIAEKKLYSNNDETIKNSPIIQDINEREKERLKNKVSQSKKFESLNGKSMMWKIVEQESLNSEYLTKNDDNMLDARVNAQNINLQVVNNNNSQYAGKQTNRNSSYNNAYKNLEKSKQITNTNYFENNENDIMKEENKNKQKFNR